MRAFALLAVALVLAVPAACADTASVDGTWRVAAADVVPSYTD